MIRKITYSLAVAALLVPVLLPGHLLAANLSSRWIVDQYSKSRLFVGGYDKEKKILHLGWHVTLKEGWKTYWRSPGDAGLPPRWAWKEAKNIDAITVNWPAPHRLNIFDMDTYIYHDEVILPIAVTIKDGQQAVSIALDMDYMICAEICVPQSASYSLDVSSLDNIKVPRFQKAQFERYRDLVPIKKSGHNVKVQHAQADMLLIDLPEEFAHVAHIIVEGPDRILFGEASAKGDRQYSVIYSGDEALSKGQQLTLTLLLKDGGANEMKVTVQ